MRPAALPSLTGLRFLLAIFVVIYHYGAGVAEQSPGWVAAWIHAGFSTVSAFFVLSGFILAHNYIGEDGGLRGSKGAFWAARFARTYPVYALSVVLSFQAYLTTQATSLGEAALATAATLLCVQAWLPQAALAINSAAWSLSVEAFLYLCFPALPGFFRGASRRRLWWTVAGCAVLSLVAPAILLYSGTGDKEWKAVVRYNPVLHLPAFVAGIAAHRLWISDPEQLRSAANWLVGAAGLLIAAAFLGSARIPFEILNNGLLLIPYVALIVGLAAGGGGRFLSHRWMVQLGEASYSLYILHLPLGLVTIPVNEELLGFGPRTWAYLVSTLAISVLVAVGAYRAVEEPHRKSLRLRLGRSQARCTA
ncbi:MAG: acyltransferase [Bryobacteraceae bacterium]|nr:acyltransferase [Bryobacteraceae bacterium]